MTAAKRPFPAASLAALCVANLVPIGGVLFLGWSTGGVLALLFAELFIIVVFLVLRVGSGEFEDFPGGVPPAFLALFIGLGAGGATYGVVDFVTALWQGAAPGAGPVSAMMFIGKELAREGLWLGAIALLCSHAVSFVRDWWQSEERYYARLYPLVGLVVARYSATLVAGISFFFISDITKVFDPRYGVVVILGARLAVELGFHIFEHTAGAFRGVDAQGAAASEKPDAGASG